MSNLDFNARCGSCSVSATYPPTQGTLKFEGAPHMQISLIQTTQTDAGAADNTSDDVMFWIGFPFVAVLMLIICLLEASLPAHRQLLWMPT